MSGPVHKLPGPGWALLRVYIRISSGSKKRFRDSTIIWEEPNTTSVSRGTLLSSASAEFETLSGLDPRDHPEAGSIMYADITAFHFWTLGPHGMERVSVTGADIGRVTVSLTPVNGGDRSRSIIMDGVLGIEGD